MSVRSAVGVYFTDEYIELSFVENNGKKLLAFYQSPINPGLIVNGEIKDKDKLLTLLAKALLAVNIPPGTDAVVGISDSRVFLREFTLPKTNTSDLDEAVEWQVKQILPVLPGEVVTDQVIIGKDESGLVEVLLTAIPKSVIESYLAFAGNVGLNVVGIEPAMFAVIRAINQNILKGKNQLLVFSGDGFMEFIYMTNGNPRFADYLPVKDVENKGGLVVAVKEYINFANSKHPERTVEEIVVAGFSPAMDEIGKRLQETGMTVVMAGSQLTSGPKGVSLLHCAHGLSLKQIFPEHGVNLLPVDFRIGQVALSMGNRWKMILAVLTSLSVLAALSLIVLWQLSKERYALLSRQKDELTAQLSASASAEIVVRAEKINQLMDRLVTLRFASGGEDGLMRELQYITPQGITLASFVYSRNLGGVRLIDKTSSWIITGSATSRQDVLTFFDSLLSLTEFENGRLYFGSLEKETGITFRIANQVTR